MSRRESILAAATKLFAARGYDATPTAEVARVAGVSEGTIFHHFKTKDGVLIHVFQMMMELYAKGVRSEVRKATNGLEAVERMICFHFDFLTEHASEAFVIFRELPPHFHQSDSPYRQMVVKQMAPIFRLMVEAIERGQKDGSIRKVASEKTAFIVRGMLIGLTRQRLFGTIEVPELCEEAVQFCRRSLKNDV